jgi:hypothetical protein
MAKKSPYKVRYTKPASFEAIRSPDDRLSAQVRAPSERTLVPDTQAKAARIQQQLAELYPNPPIPLDHKSTFQLLCAVLLSAQVGGGWQGARWAQQQVAALVVQRQANNAAARRGGAACSCTAGPCRPLTRR